MITPTPRRRWYHRYAVLEMSLILPRDTVISWHITRWGAARTAGEHIAFRSALGGALELGGFYVSEVRDFVALPADHFRVEMAARQ